MNNSEYSTPQRSPTKKRPQSGRGMSGKDRRRAVSPRLQSQHFSQQQLPHPVFDCSTPFAPSASALPLSTSVYDTPSQVGTTSDASSGRPFKIAKESIISDCAISASRPSPTRERARKVPEENQGAGNGHLLRAEQQQGLGKFAGDNSENKTFFLFLFLMVENVIRFI